LAQVRLLGVEKKYGDFLVVKPTDLDISDGELVVLVGPSGCGKSTTLRMIAGLESVTNGEIWIGNELVNDLAPKDRDIAMVFQSYALYPHMTVYQNMAFGLRLKRFDREEIKKRVEEAAAILELDELLDRLPKDLSGGQRQRVAMGRAIVRKPSLFLFDEPLSNLDAKLRVQMRAEVARLHRQLGATMIYVTHDQVEAMTLADRVVVLDNGQIQQVGSPMEVYNRPHNAFVAGFIGSPSMNFLPSEVMGTGPETSLLGEGFCIPVPKKLLKAVASQGSRNLVMGIRPEHFRLAKSNDDESLITCRVEVVEQMGAEVMVTGMVGETGITVRLAPEQAPKVGETVGLVPLEDKIHLFDKDTRRSLLSEPAGTEVPAVKSADTDNEPAEKTKAGPGVKTKTKAGRVTSFWPKVAVILLLALFAGLVYFTLPPGPDQGITGEEPLEAEPAPRKHVVLWHSYQDQEKKALEKLISRFNQVQSKILVESLAIPYDSFVDKLNAALPRGQGPDLFLFAHDRVGDWADAGLIEPIEFWTGERITRRFFPKTLEALTYKGSLYGLPVAFKTLALYYNRKLVNTPPSTTSQMIKLAKKLTNRKKKKFGLVYEYNKLFFHSVWFHGYGARIFDDKGRLAIPSKGALQSFKFISWIRNKAKIVPPEVDAVLTSALFNQGKAAMVISGPWFRGQISKKIKYGVALLPEVDSTGIPGMPFLTAEGFMISSRSKVKKEAFRVAEYLTTDESALFRLLQAGQNVANIEPYNNKQARKDPVLAVFRAQVDRSVLMPNIPAMRLVWTPMDRALSNSNSGRMEPRQAILDAVDEIRRYITVTGNPGSGDKTTREKASGERE